jgi:hypothetical protein
VVSLTVTLDQDGTTGVMTMGVAAQAHAEFRVTRWRETSPGVFRADLEPAPGEAWREAMRDWLGEEVGVGMTDKTMRG